jgi:hypothetical protein
MSIYTPYPERYIYLPTLSRKFWLFLTMVLLFTTLLVTYPWSVNLPATINPSIIPKNISALHKLPLAFTPNAGQADPTVRFQARGMGGAVSFKPDEIGVVLPKQGIGTDRATLSSNGQIPHDRSLDSETVVRLRFDGANPTPRITGVDPQPGIVNYFIGNDTTKWHTNLTTYAGVVYEQLYPGIRLRYEGVDTHLKSTYTIDPGADPAQIRWHYDDATDVRIEAHMGSVLVQTSDVASSNSSIQDSALAQLAPIAWQEIDGETIAIPASYLHLNDMGYPMQHPTASAQNPVISFAIGDYNPDYALMISLVLEYSSYLGGSESGEVGYDIAVDRAGYAYITGWTDSGNFPLKNAAQEAAGGNQDAFVAKFNPNASGEASLVYATYIGGSERDIGYSIATMTSGGETSQADTTEVVLTGATLSDNFPTTEDALQPEQLSPLSGKDAFITRLNAQGQIVYSTYFGGQGGDEGRGIALDAGGNIYVGGITSFAPDFPAIVNGFQTSFPGAGGSDGFVAKINAAGTAIIWSSLAGGTYTDEILDIALDNQGNAYLTGYTEGLNFPITEGAFQAERAGPDRTFDPFVMKVNPSATGQASLVYSTYLGGDESDERGTAIAVDNDGHAYVTGVTTSDNFPTRNPIQDFQGARDAFVAKLNADGSDLIYATYLGGVGGSEFGHSIALDSSGNAYIVGLTRSGDFPVVNPLQTSLGTPDSIPDHAFLTQINATGSAFVYSTYLSGQTNIDQAYGVAVDAANNAYITGSTFTDNFPTTADAFQPTFAGGLLGPDGGDVFVTKINSMPEEEAIESPGSVYLPLIQR